jgi:PAS domain S-box-containing protein
LRILILLAVAPLFAVMLFNAAEQRATRAAQAQADALRLARVSATRHEQLIEGTRQTLIALSRFPAVRNGEAQACHALFADLLDQYPYYTNLTALDLDGDVFCSAIPLTKPVNAADRPWFQRVRQTRTFTISDYQIGRITYRPILTTAYPITDEDDGLLGIVTIGIDIAWLNQLVAATPRPEGASFTVLDRAGTVLARAPDPEAWVGRSAAGTPLFSALQAQHGSGTTITLGLDGLTRLFGFTPLGDTEELAAYLVVGIPTAQVFAETDRILVRSLIALSAIAVLGLVAAWLMADLLFVRRIRRLAQTAADLSAGQWSARAGSFRANDELGLLARAFDDMAAALEDHEARQRDAEAILKSEVAERKQAEEEIRRLNQDLERRVRERTAQLGAANTQLEAEVVERRRIEAALRASESQLRLLIEQANDAIFLENEEDEILDVNSRACEMLGYSREELLSMKVPDLMPPEIRGVPGQVVRAELASNRIFETVDLRKDGTRVPLEISTRRIVGVPGDLVLVIARDITGRKQAEEAMRAALAKEKEVSGLKSHLISTTSHEFRTPLSTILSSAQLLEQYAVQISPTKQATHLQHIQVAARQMADLLNDILTLARVDAGRGRCTPAPLDLPALCATLAEEAQITDHAGRQIHLTVQAAQAVALLDEKLLRQILQNLLSNALKYSPPAGVVYFDLHIQDNFATFTIRDQGIGIPADEQAHLFEPFYRASNVVNTPGSGLGMAIAKSSVDLHGGTITVDSKLGVGTVVTVNIPIREPVTLAKTHP